MEGSAEGLSESVERYDLGPTTADAINLTRETGRQVADETRHQLDTPEGRAAREAAAKGRDRVAGAAQSAQQSASQQWNEAKAAAGQRTGAAAHRVQDTTERVKGGVQNVTERVQATSERVQHQAHELRETAEHRIDEVRETAEHRIHEIQEDAREMAADARQKAGAVQESARRAKTAPGKIMHEMGSAIKEAASGYGLWIAGLAVAGLIALDALVVLTIWLVAAMSALVGFVLGTLLAGLILVVIAVAAFYFGRSKRKEGQHRMQEGVQESREVIQNVQEPVRREFGGGSRAH